MSSSNNIVKFQPFASTVEPSFWLSLSKLKLHILKLNQDFITVSGSFGIAPPSTRAKGSSGASGAVRVRLDQSSLPSFDEDNAVEETKSEAARTAAQECIKNELLHISNGKIMILNTKESFKTCDKNEFLNENGLPPLLQCCGVNLDKDDEEKEEEDLAALQSFLVSTYMNLKDHSIVYWFAFPALSPKTGKSITYAGEGQVLLEKAWSQGMTQSLHCEYFKLRVENLQKAVKKEKQKYHGCTPYFLILPKEDGVEIRELSFEAFQNLTKEEKDCVIFGFLDPTPSSTTNTQQQQQQQPVGWTLRNLIAYLSLKLELGGHDVHIVSFRPKMLRRISLDSLDGADVEKEAQDGGSLLLHIKLPEAQDYQWPTKDATSLPTPNYKCVGWELNARSKPGPRSLNLTPLLSPTHLALQAMDLNLRLMKWRMVPSLNLEKLSSLKVLLLGAGTLGCAVARDLLAWGVRDITFLDNGKVSYSNPVRQNLFTVKDCENGGKDKAATAASALADIAGVSVRSTGVKLSIPMPGHDITSSKEEEESVKQEIQQLIELVQQSDVIFLLTDTRESRWLPCVLARSYSKMLINAALGFDSWLVMRHGTSSSSGVRLGCYFCNDVVAPENSLKDRTIDQQCTVTRPGVANIAAAMAVELMVSCLHHTEGVDAPAPPTSISGAGTGSSANYAPGVSNDSAASSPLGIMPHQIRGSLTSYTIMTPTVPAFKYCTGCSDAVVDAYRKDGYEFVKRACCSEPSYLEDVSGLTGFREEAAVKMEQCLEDDWDFEEDEDNDVLLDG